MLVKWILKGLVATTRSGRYKVLQVNPVSVCLDYAKDEEAAAYGRAQRRCDGRADAARQVRVCAMNGCARLWICCAVYRWGLMRLCDRLAKLRLVVGLTHKEVYGRTLLLVCT